MKKEYRVRKTQEFQRIMQKKQFVVNQSFSLYYDSKQEEHGRFGVSCSKKLGNAVVRNKTKRQARMMLLELEATAFPFDGIVIVRQGYFSLSYEENKKNLDSLLKKVKIEK